MNHHLSQPRQGGFVLVTALLFLLAIALLGLAMMRSFGLNERIAGNTRDKLRAFSVAQSALQYGEWWLTQGDAGPAAACAGVSPVTGMSICETPLADPAQLPWAAHVDYQPPGLSVSSSGGVAASGDINFRAMPGLHISHLGPTPDGTGQLYRVSAFAYGGDPNTAAVVQSTYRLSSGGVKDLGGL